MTTLLLPQSGWLIGKYRWSADGGHQQSARLQHLIADHLGGHAKRWSPCQQTVVGIDRLRSGIDGRRLSPGGREQHLLESRFQVPAISDEFCREVIEKLSVRGSRSLATEVTRGGNDPLPEGDLPQSIDRDSCRQRVTLRDEPASQRQSVSGGSIGERRQDRRHIW